MLDNDLLLLAHSVRSGYLEERSALQIVKPGPDWDYVSLAMATLVGTGDINQIIMNPVEDTELILAC